MGFAEGALGSHPTEGRSDLGRGGAEACEGVISPHCDDVEI